MLVLFLNAAEVDQFCDFVRYPVMKDPCLQNDVKFTRFLKRAKNAFSQENLKKTATNITKCALGVAAIYGTYNYCNEQIFQPSAKQDLGIKEYTETLTNSAISLLTASLSKNTVLPALYMSLSMFIKPIKASCVVNPIPDQVIEVNTAFKILLDSGSIFNKSTPLIVREKSKKKLPNLFNLNSKINFSYNKSISDFHYVPPLLFLSDKSGFEILDVKDFKNPIILGNYDVPGILVTQFLLIGSFVYTAHNSGGFHIVNITDVRNPKKISSYNNTKQTAGIAKYKNFVVLNSITGLDIVDVSDIFNPLKVNNYISLIQRITVDKSLLFLVNHTGLFIFNITNSGNLLSVSNYTSSIKSFLLSNSLIVFTDVFMSINLINLSDPQKPLLEAQYKTDSPTGSFWELVMVDNILFARYQDYIDSYLSILDINSKIELYTNYLNQDISGFTPIKIFNNLLFGFSGNNLLEIRNLTAGSLEIRPPIALSRSQYIFEIVEKKCNTRFAVTFNQSPKRTSIPFAHLNLYPLDKYQQSLNSLFFDPDENFLSFSLTTKNNVSLSKLFSVNYKLGFIDRISGCAARYLEIVNEYLFVACNGGLQIFEVNNPMKPNQITNYKLIDSQIFSISDRIGYFAGYYSNINVLNLTDLKNPVMLNTHTISLIKDMCIEDSRGYFVTNGILQILDISLPSKFTLISNYNITNSNINNIIFLNYIGYISHTKGLNIVDFSDVTNPQELSYLPFMNPGKLHLQGMMAFLPEKSGLHIINLQNLLNPTVLTNSINTNNQPNYLNYFMTIGSLGFACLGSVYSSTLQAFDLTNIFFPALLDIYSIGGNCLGLRRKEQIMYIAGGIAELLIIDVNQWEISMAVSNNDYGNYPIKITARDALQVETSDSFTIRVEGPPAINSLISLQLAKIGKSFTYFLPKGVIIDPNNDPLSFDTLNNSIQTLPSWLSFNSISAIFAGSPPEMSNQTQKIFITATDNIPNKMGLIETVNTTLEIYIDHEPQVNLQIPKQTAGIDLPYLFTLSSNTFSDPDGDPLHYEALNLPLWLNFDNTTLTFFGTPKALNNGTKLIQVAALDLYNGTAIGSFELLVENFPKLNFPLANQIATLNKPFSYTIPPNNFIDFDQDPLTYIARLLGRVDLPPWLQFDPAIRQFSGVPKDLSNYTIEVVANDPHGGKASGIFNLLIQSKQPIENQLADIAAPFEFILPADALNDQGGGKLNYEAYKRDGTSLPSWLNFSQNILMGVPTEKDVGTLSLQIKATDPFGGQVAGYFDLIVEHFPKLKYPLQNHIIGINRQFTHIIPSDIFYDLDQDPLTYNASSISINKNLPYWMKFDPIARQFTGKPLNKENYTLAVTASDPKGGTCTASFQIEVASVPVKNKAVPTQPYMKENQTFAFTIPSDIFIDEDGHVAYNLALSDDSPLPDWLKFDPTTFSVSGFPSSDAIGSYALKLTAMNQKGLNASTIFPLEISKNFAPEVIKPLSSQVATVNKDYALAIAMKEIFVDKNNDVLIYSMRLDTEETLPQWLKFQKTENPSIYQLVGKPGMGDLKFFTDRTLKIALRAEEMEGQKLSATTYFDLRITGQTYGALLIKILSPVGTALGVGLTVYKNHALILNYFNKKKYQKDTVILSSESPIKKLETRLDATKDYYTVSAHIAAEPQPKWYQLWKDIDNPFPGGFLPSWLQFNAGTNMLKFVEADVEQDDIMDLIIRVKSRYGVILEEFPLKIADEAIDEEVGDEYGEEEEEASESLMFEVIENSFEDSFQSLYKTSQFN